MEVIVAMGRRESFELELVLIVDDHLGQILQLCHVELGLHDCVLGLLGYLHHLGWHHHLVTGKVTVRPILWLLLLRWIVYLILVHLVLIAGLL